MATAGMRLQRKGSVFSRVRDLIKTGAIPYENRPLWYDVYVAFPPLREPVYAKEPQPDSFGLINVEDNVRPIFYAEDWARATFNQHFKRLNATNTSMFIEDNQKHKNMSMRFVEKFEELQKQHENLSKEEVFDRTLQNMNISG